MAYDKLCDSAVLDAGLKQIADAIREKGGTSDNLAFPAGMAEAIAAIEAGVDLGELFDAKVATGSFIPSSGTTEVANVDFGGIFSAVPYFFFVFENIAFSGGTENRFYCQFSAHQKRKDVKSTANVYTNTIYIDGNKKIFPAAYGWGDSIMSEDSGAILFNDKRQGLAGNEYFWIALGE